MKYQKVVFHIFHILSRVFLVPSRQCHMLLQALFISFPARSLKSSFADGLRYSAYLKVFCSCQMPEEGHYVICDKCNIWYHPRGFILPVKDKTSMKY